MNGSLRKALLCCSAGFLALGCGPPRPVEIRTAADAAEYASCPPAGGVRIAGTSFARQRVGSIVPGTGRPVNLDPATRYSTAVFQAITERQNRESYFKVEKESQTAVPDPVLLKCRRTASVDAEGRFAFENVAPGTYFVSSYVSWLSPVGEWLGTWNVSRIVVGGEGVPALLLSGVPASIPDMPAR